MPINEGTLVDPARLGVAWFKVSPPGEAVQAFTTRGFAVERCSKHQIGDSAFLAGLAAVVFVQRSGRLRDIESDIEDFALPLLAYGCHVIAVPASGQLASLIHLISRTSVASIASLASSTSPDKILPFPHVRIYDESPSWDAIANFVQKYPPGRAPNLQLLPDFELKANGETVALSDDRIRLLQRAFADCERVHLKPLAGGLSGAEVYVAYPTLKATYNIGRQPLPYFVKIDVRKNTLMEYKNYRERVNPHIPFHLGPHLIDERCFLGANDGVIVGDYVEESESLVDCAKAGRAGHAIACLFNRTLHGWYRDAKELPGFKYQPFRDDLPLERAKLAKRLGAKNRLKLLTDTFTCCNCDQMMVGPIHGDLNAKNVRVRGVDAIVIDFLGHRNDGDIIYDAANLEASLFVDGFAKNHLRPRAAMKEVKESLCSIWPMYDRSLALSLVPPHPDPENPSRWFYECVRQIRRYARQMECHAGQYAVALGRALLKKAVREDTLFSVHENYLRAAAFVIAESVLIKTFPRSLMKAGVDRVLP